MFGIKGKISYLNIVQVVIALIGTRRDCVRIEKVKEPPMIKILNDAKIKLKTEKGVEVQFKSRISTYLLARAISLSYGYAFDGIKKDKCLAFIKKYVNNSPRLKPITPAPKLPPEKDRWYKSKEFLTSDEWFKLRYRVIERHGGKCQCCGADRKSGAVIQVDHIKPRSIYPELAVDENNLQLLCKACNVGKSNKYATDWR